MSTGRASRSTTHRASSDTKGAPRSANGRRGGRPSQRDQLVAAAVELFAKGGTRGTTLEAIAQEIGVTRPAITHHFGTKEGLLHEVVAVTDSLDEMALANVGTTGIEQLASLRSWASVLDSDPGLANLSKLSVVITVEAFEAGYPAHRQFVLRHKRFRRAVQRIIELGQGDGSIRVDVDAEAMSGEIIAFMQGCGVQWFLDPRHFDLAGVYRQYFDRLIRDVSVETAVRGSSSVKQDGVTIDARADRRRSPANQTRRPVVKNAR